jgi:uncharacterized membrane protein HdeD (DUF308 family)
MLKNKIINIAEKLKEISDTISVKYGRLKYLIGIVLILFGVFALVTPFTPGAFFTIILGLQIIGINLIKAK